MSNINQLVLLDEGWGKALLAGGLAALGAGAIASQTHTGKAAINFAKSKMESNPIKSKAYQVQAAAHGLQSPLLRNKTVHEIGKRLAKTAVAGGLAYGAKKAYDYTKTPEGQAKINKMKQNVTDFANNTKKQVSSWTDKIHGFFNGNSN